MPKFAFVSKLAITLRVLVALSVLCRLFATPFSCPGPCIVGVAFVSLLFAPSFFRVDQQLSPGHKQAANTHSEGAEFSMFDPRKIVFWRGNG
jgi:hypothetical protein